MANAKTPSEKDYARLGKTLEKVLLQYNLQVTRHWGKFIALSFVRGLFMGLGSIIGATLLVALIVWLLNIFGGLPVFGEWFDALRESIRQSSTS
ncbi:MAG: DUF5665 domain-containing protein [Candidatus Saccharimonadales bacterium]